MAIPTKRRAARARPAAEAAIRSGSGGWVPPGGSSSTSTDRRLSGGPAWTPRAGALEIGPGRLLARRRPARARRSTCSPSCDGPAAREPPPRQSHRSAGGAEPGATSRQPQVPLLDSMAGDLRRAQRVSPATPSPASTDSRAHPGLFLWAVEESPTRGSRIFFLISGFPAVPAVPSSRGRRGGRPFRIGFLRENRRGAADPSRRNWVALDDLHRRRVRQRGHHVQLVDLLLLRPRSTARSTIGARHRRRMDAVHRRSTFYAALARYSYSVLRVAGPAGAGAHSVPTWAPDRPAGRGGRSRFRAHFSRVHPGRDGFRRSRGTLSSGSAPFGMADRRS